MNSDFLYLLNVALAMISQNLAIKSLKIGVETIDLPRLSGSDLTGALTVDDAVICASILGETHAPDVNLVLEQIKHNLGGYGGENYSDEKISGIIQVSGDALLKGFTGVAAILSAKNTTTTNTNTITATNGFNSSTTTTNTNASLGVYAGLSIGAAVLVAVILMRK